MISRFQDESGLFSKSKASRGGMRKDVLAKPGRWRVEYAAEMEVARGSAGALDVFATLSMAANSEVNNLNSALSNNHYSY